MRRVEIADRTEPIVLGAGEIHFRDFELEPGEFLHVVVQQLGVDLVLEWQEPSSGERLRIDSPNGSEGPEELALIADLPGRHRLELMPASEDSSPGRYALAVRSRRAARPEDRGLVEADRLHREGARLASEGELDGAERSFQRALEIQDSLGLRSREAETLRELGFVHYRRGEPAAAREVWERTLSWYRVLDEPGIGYVLHDLGSLELRLGGAAAATERLEEALAVFEEQGDERGAVSTLATLGTAFRIRGYLQRSVDCLEQAAQRAGRLGRPELAARVEVDHAALLLDLGRPAEALASLRRAVEAYRKLGDAEGTSLALRGIADAALRSGDHALAERTALEALEALEALGPEPPGRARSAALAALAAVRRERQDWLGAEQALDEALGLARAGARRRDEAILLVGLAYVHAASGRAVAGLELYREALEIFREIGSRSGEATVHARAAEALRDLGRLEEASGRAEAALELVETMRSETLREDFRLSYFGARQDYFEIAVDLRLRLHEAAPAAGHDARAFVLHERRLARELLGALLLDTDPAAAAPLELLEEERRLHRELSRRAGETEAAADDRLVEVVDRLQTIRGSIRGLSAAREPAAATVDPARARELLDPRTLLLAYVLGGERGHVLALSSEGLRVRPLAEPDRIEKRARELAAALRRVDARSRARQVRLSEELGELLLAPVADLLAAGRRLVVVVPATLQAIPFAVLAAPAGGLLIEHHEIVHLPSVTALEALRGDPDGDRGSARGVVVFADPAFAAGGPDPPLPGSRTEAEAVAALWSGDPPPVVVVGAAARREAFVERDWRPVEMLYLATHAVAEARPELSGLVLSTADERGRQRPGFVSALEISRLDLPADLVVLSACETALGPSVRGEGTIGLAWSFLYAGARRVVASLWRIDDRRTATLMTRFLELHHRGRLPVAAALRRAQLEAIARPGATANDWAGFVLVGDWRDPDGVTGPEDGS